MSLNPGRETRITASFVPKLMQGDANAIHREWQRLVGDPAYVPENLDDIWAVQFGKYIETFALDWHQRRTGQKLTLRQKFLVHGLRPYVCCTLDAFRESDLTVIDCKASGRNIADILTTYAPQMVVQRACIPTKNAALLILSRGGEPKEYPVTITEEYEAQVWDRIDAFWRCVETLTPPIQREEAA